MKVTVEIERDVARALYERLLKPTKDNDGHVVYTVPVMLASEVRQALFEAVKD